MPLIEHVIYPDLSEYGIWKIEESKEQLMKRLVLSDEEKEEMEGFAWHERQLQWLAVRWLLHIMSGRTNRGIVFKDKTGKPSLSDSLFNITLSHSHQFVAAAAAPYPIGVDIQVKSERMGRIVKKFAGASELEACMESDNLNLAHLIWSAKECMFKAYGREEISFRDHLHICFPSDVKSMQSKGEFRGEASKDGELMRFNFNFVQDEEKVFVLGRSFSMEKLKERQA